MRDGPVEMPGRDRDERLHGQIELRAEAAADGRRHDPHIFRREAKDRRDIVAIHVGRLRAGGDLHAVADAPRKARFRLDIGVLDEAGLERAFDDDVGFGKRSIDIALADAAARPGCCAGGSAWISGAARERRFADREQRRQRSPGDREMREIERGDRVGSPTIAATASPRKRDSSSAKTG